MALHGDEIIELQGQYYIRASSSRVDDRTLVLKQGDSFGVFDRFGDIHPVRAGEEGVFHRGTRFLSHLDLRLGGDRPLLLNSAVKRDSVVLAADLSNPDVELSGVQLRRGDLHLFRSKFLWDGACHERVRITSFLDEPLRVPLTITYAADFADLFEVRGVARRHRGRQLPTLVGGGGKAGEARQVGDLGEGGARVALRYAGLDGLVRTTVLSWSPAPEEVGEDRARFALALPARGVVTVHMTSRFLMSGGPGHGHVSGGGGVAGRGGGARAPSAESAAADAWGGSGRAPGGAMPPALTGARAWEAAREAADAAAREAQEGACTLRTANAQFNGWLQQSVADLRMMLTRTPHGWYPYAGVPWFNTVFGRDGLITALEALWFQPAVARGVLAYLAAHQATGTDASRDEEPGKVLHETRDGEMAALDEVPFGRYYGSVDATPLFVMLAGAYLERTGDRDLAAALWPAVERALAWMRGPGDVDGDGFVEYARGRVTGLANQGWKDSEDAVFHADGTLAKGPIALCEVQAYAYGALQQAARMARTLGHGDRAAALARDAERLRDAFEGAFWSPKLGTYALALDGAKQPCQVRTSNAGHTLLTGIATPGHARRVASGLLDDEGFSGWGIRTVPEGEARYNPMSYHNGSIWPHDNALVAAGLARYGLKHEALRVLGGMFDASTYLDLQRMPELFCGFPRRASEGPTLYPVACAPQSWAAAVPLMLLQAALGLRVEALEGRVVLERPMLPEFLPRVELHGLVVRPPPHDHDGPGGRGAWVDIVCERAGEGVTVHVPRRSGSVDVVTVK